jgi:hypothetical protein
MMADVHRTVNDSSFISFSPLNNSLSLRLLACVDDQSYRKDGSISCFDEFAGLLSGG